MTDNRSRWPVFVSGTLALVSMGLLVAVWVWRGSVIGDSETGSSASGDTTPTANTERRDASAIERILDTADALVRDGEADRAAAVLVAAVGENPEDQELRLALGGAYVLLTRLADAYAQYEAALAIGPRTPAIEFDAGTIATQLNRLDRAEEHFSAAQAADGSDPRYPLYLAQVLTRQNRIDEARKQLLLATRIDDSLAMAWGSLAELSLRENDANIALQMIARARDLEPGVTAWRVIEARALKRSLRAADALAVLEPIPDGERRSLPILRLIGEIHGMLGQPQAAAAEFEAAALDRPGDGELQLETAIWLERVGRDDDALRFASRAAALGVEAGERMAARLAADAGG